MPWIASESRIEGLLADDEEIVARARLHWMVYRWPFILFFYGLVMCILAFAMFVNPALAIPPALIMFASVFGAALTRLRRQATEMVLTDRRLIILEGFVKPVDRAIRLSDIKDVSVKQDPLSRSLDFGNVEVELASGERRSLKPVAEARKFVSWIKQVAEPDSDAGGTRPEPEAERTWSVTSDAPLAGTRESA
jgi:membrane protein YdbS with pleckstrin-like domain